MIQEDTKFQEHMNLNSKLYIKWFMWREKKNKMNNCKLF